MFNTESPGTWTVVRLVGQLDLAVAEEFRATIDDAVNSGANRLAIDFSEVTFLDSSGISVIITALKLMNAVDGQLVLVGLTERTRLPLEITGVTKIIDIRDRLDSVEEFAVEWVL